MDVNATWDLMVDPNNDIDERAVAAVDLLVWLAGGGLTPRAAPREHAIDLAQYNALRALDRLAELEEKEEA